MSFENYSFLDTLSRQEVQVQIEDMLNADLIPMIEHMENPGPHDIYWALWRLPHEKYVTAQWVVGQIDLCAKKNPFHHIKLSGYDRHKKVVAQSFIVKKPANS